MPSTRWPAGRHSPGPRTASHAVDPVARGAPQPRAQNGVACRRPGEAAAASLLTARECRRVPPPGRHRKHAAATARMGLARHRPIGTASTPRPPARKRYRTPPPHRDRKHTAATRPKAPWRATNRQDPGALTHATTARRSRNVAPAPGPEFGVACHRPAGARGAAASGSGSGIACGRPAGPPGLRCIGCGPDDVECLPGGAARAPPFGAWAAGRRNPRTGTRQSRRAPTHRGTVRPTGARRPGRGRSP